MSQGGEERRRERRGGASGASELCSVSAMACESARDREQEGAKGESELERERGGAARVLHIDERGQGGEHVGGGVRHAVVTRYSQSAMMLCS